MYNQTVSQIEKLIYLPNVSMWCFVYIKLLKQHQQMEKVTGLLTYVWFNTKSLKYNYPKKNNDSEVFV